jgi:hypothetical protein
MQCSLKIQKAVGHDLGIKLIMIHGIIGKWPNELGVIIQGAFDLSPMAAFKGSI